MIQNLNELINFQKILETEITRDIINLSLKVFLFSSNRQNRDEIFLRRKYSSLISVSKSSLTCLYFDLTN